MTRIGIAAALAMLFTVSGVVTLMGAIGAPAPVGWVCLAAALSVALCGCCAWSGVAAAIGAAAFVALAGSYLAPNLGAFEAVRMLFVPAGGDPAALARGARLLSALIASALGAAFFALLYRRDLTPMAILVLFLLLVGSHAASDTAPLIAAVPGLIGAAAAFALTGGVQRDAHAVRVLAPSALAVALALLLVPAGRVTWQPLEDAANRVRSVFEQYFNFTRERIAFSISEQGYDHAGEVGDSVVSMLGGPAAPKDDPVMRVRADAELLLRGTVRTAYTGYSWVDVLPKNRYLYYDPTHRGMRERVFGLNLDVSGGGFAGAEAEVEMLDAGTSTLFVPGRLTDFTMDLASAVYYNTAGEMFMAREVRAGDRYALRAEVPAEGPALRAAALRAEAADDDRYPDILAQHTALPESVESGVYDLALRVTQGAETPYDRAAAIADYLRQNMRYTLEVDYPPAGRDFVSHFLLDTREGYCSYFATAMAVMGRVAGLPTRYVEGYLARPGADGEVVLTGWDAHAWAEVYFRGIGWVPFDATNGAEGNGGSGPEGDSGTSDSDAPEDAPTPEPSEAPDDGLSEPTPSPPTDGGQDDNQDDNQDDAPPETPEPSGEPDARDDDAPDAEDQDPPRAGGGWLWFALALLLLALIALAALWVRRRLRESDPARLALRARRIQQAAMIVYRANLTLLAHAGQVPASGETPAAFAARLPRPFNSPDFAAFVEAATNSRYGRRGLERSDIEAGLRAYAAFGAVMGRWERLRFALTRVLRGLGDFESIP